MAMHALHQWDLLALSHTPEEQTAERAHSECARGLARASSTTFRELAAWRQASRLSWLARSRPEQSALPQLTGVQGLGEKLVLAANGQQGLATCTACCLQSLPALI